MLIKVNFEALGDPNAITHNLYHTTWPSCIIFYLNIKHFEIKSGVIQLLPNFYTMDTKSRYMHLHEFEEVCATIIYKILA